MKLLSLTCRGCGAPLDVPAFARQVECEYCASKFTVEESQMASVEPVASEPQTEPDPPEVATLKQNLHNLDLEWIQRKARYVKIALDGRFTVPDVDGCRMAQIASGVLLLSAIVVAVVANSLIIFGIGVPIGALGLFVSSTSLKSARAYRRHYDKYRTDRMRLLLTLDETRREAAVV